MNKPFVLTTEDRKHLKKKVWYHLTTYCRGRAAAIRGKDLAWQLGYGDDRKIRLIIRELIAEGVPIASSVSEPMGFYIVANEHEAADYIRVLKERIKEDMNRLHDFEKATSHLDIPIQSGLFQQ